MIFILPFFFLTHKITYIARYLLTMDDEYSVHHDHIWVVLRSNALNNNTTYDKEGAS